MKLGNGSDSMLIDLIPYPIGSFDFNITFAINYINFIFIVIYFDFHRYYFAFLVFMDRKIRSLISDLGFYKYRTIALLTEY